MKETICIGTVESINYNEGSVRVIREDKDNSVSFELPFMSFEYNPPEIGDMVLIAYLSNDITQGFVLGTPYNENRKPKNGSGNIIRKDFDQNNYMEYDKSTRTLSLQVEHIKLNGKLLFENEEGE